MTRGADVEAYLDRLGVGVEPPSPAALARLQRAHVERIGYENVWIHLDERWTVDPDESLRRIARTRRGGYCFQLNGAFSTLLTELGYRVTRHIAGVHGEDGPHPDELGNHVALIVDGLPRDDSPHGRWYVDAGLGDSLYEPMPLRAGVSVQGPIRFELAPTDEGWHLAVGPGASICGVAIVYGPVEMDVFADRNEYFRTSPDSPFARSVTVQRRYRAGTAVVRGRVFARTEDGHASIRTCESRDDWLDLLDTEFGVRLDVPGAELDELWSRMRVAHELWARNT
ncbi:MAG: arylamine N-acetyltransferase family protein [Jatrophihabitans sp.]